MEAPEEPFIPAQTFRSDPASLALRSGGPPRGGRLSREPASRAAEGSPDGSTNRSTRPPMVCRRTREPTWEAPGGSRTAPTACPSDPSGGSPAASPTRRTASSRVARRYPPGGKALPKGPTALAPIGHRPMQGLDSAPPHRPPTHAGPPRRSPLPATHPHLASAALAPTAHCPSQRLDGAPRHRPPTLTGPRRRLPPPPTARSLRRRPLRRIRMRSPYFRPHLVFLLVRPVLRHATDLPGS